MIIAFAPCAIFATRATLAERSPDTVSVETNRPPISTVVFEDISVKQLAANRAVSRIRKTLEGLPCVPNRELLALSEPAKRLIEGLRGGDTQQNDKRFQLGAVLLQGQRAAKSGGHYLSWCNSLGLQPRTAQNYVRIASAFGECHGPFCDLKTTTIYRLAASSEEIQAKALEAAKSGSFTSAAASALLKREAKSGVVATETVRRVAAIFDSLKPPARAELVALLPTINLKKLLVLLSDGTRRPQCVSSKEATPLVAAVPGRQKPVAPLVTSEPPPIDTYILERGEGLQHPA